MRISPGRTLPEGFLAVRTVEETTATAGEASPRVTAGPEDRARPSVLPPAWRDSSSPELEAAPAPVASGDRPTRGRTLRRWRRRRETLAAPAPSEEATDGHDDVAAWLADGSVAHCVELATPDPDREREAWNGLADNLDVRELQRRLRAESDRQRAALEGSRDSEPCPRAQDVAPRREVEDFAPTAGHLDGARLEAEFWAEGSTMPQQGWFGRRRRRSGTQPHDEPEAVTLDLSAYEVAPERHGTFRTAVAQAAERERASVRSGTRVRADGAA